MITISPRAIEELQSIKATKNAPDDHGLRILVQKGGCAGMQYGMKFDAPAANDEITETNGVRVLVDPQSLPFLNGCILDFSDALSDSGFKINNPNAERSCGCGSSFEPTKSTAAANSTPPTDPEIEALECTPDEEDAQS